MCQRCDWEGSLDQIEDLLEDDEFEFAEETLKGIRKWIKENEHVTPSQEQAIANIANYSTL